MHICILTDRFPPHNKSGGISVIAASLAEQYTSMGCNVTVVTTTQDPNLTGRTREGPIDVYRVYARARIRLRAYYSIYNPLTVPKVKRFFSVIEPDIIHAHSVHEFLSYHTLRAAKKKSIPVVLTFHDVMSFAYGKLTHFVDDVDEDRLPEVPADAYQVSTLDLLDQARTAYFPLRNVLNKWYLGRYVDHSVAVSHELRKALHANGIGCDGVVHNGIDVETFANGNGDRFRENHELGEAPFIFYAGRIGYWKGGEHLARAFRIVADAFPDVRLVVATSHTEYIDEMRDFAAPHGERIVDVGWLSDCEMRDAYHAATMAVTPSICLETFGNINLEALATATPVVTTCFGGGKELVVDGETGLVVNPLDVDALADALSELLSDSQKRVQFGRNGRERVVNEFTIEQQAGEYLDIFSRFVT